MKAVIKIKMDNAAFEEPGYELGRILKEAGERLQDGEIMAFNLYDINGNRVGELKVSR